MRIKPIKYSSKDALLSALPKRYYEKAQINDEGPFALVMLDTDVAHSSAIEKALRKLPTGYKLVLAANNMTIEANKILNESESIAITLSDFPWTDERHEDIKVLIGSNVKKPN